LALDRRQATAVGFGAVLLWGTLAPLAVAAKAVPPFQMTATAFGFAFVFQIVLWLARGQSPRERLRLPAAAWLHGVYGLFGYHALYFFAFRRAPAVEVNLINYLWPLLIVLFSALLPGERLRALQVLGALVGFAGVAAMIDGDGAPAFETGHAIGFVAALGCAVVWSSYSVSARLFSQVPSDAVGGVCGATAALALVCHLAFETTHRPDVAEWLMMAAMGLGPTGAAFLMWDVGMKRGNMPLLGVAAYAAPVLSTALLIVFGLGEFRPAVALACLAVALGAALAGRRSA
jgi:drug/metabolite transporter (DMT)-like permease